MHVFDEDCVKAMFLIDLGFCYGMFDKVFDGSPCRSRGVSKKPSEPGKGNVCTMPMSIGRGFV